MARRTSRSDPGYATAVLAVLLAATIALWAATTKPGPPPHELIEVVVKPGDTLWKLATTHYPGKDPREVVYIIREANGGLDPGALRPGDVVLVPKKEVLANQSGTKRATAATVAE